MFSSASYPSNVNGGSAQDARPLFPHSHSHPTHQGGFGVAGMSNPAASHSPSPRGSGLGNSMSMSGSLGIGSSLGEGLSQQRTHYQPGYLMSATQNNVVPQGSQRHEEAPMVQTKAKLNHVLAGSSASDFGMDSMFESSRQYLLATVQEENEANVRLRQRHRQPLADEDAPPTNSVNDIVNEVYSDTGPYRFAPRNSTIDHSSSRTPLFRSSHPATPKSTPPTQQPLYVVVFGYPPDKYSVAVEYFRSIGETTEAEQNTEISNCFRLGYLNPAEAMRAVRKNGDVLSGSWMVGVKFADPIQAESILGPAAVGGLTQSVAPSPDAMSTSPPSGLGMFSSVSHMSIDEPRSPPTPSTPTPVVGTPIRLAPSAAAFRKPGMSAGGGPPQKTQASQSVNNTLPSASPASPNKGMLEQVSDLIFGW
ncbi:uncharacterized protein FIBRA_01717 [Fibroporia radiculosa]|uniref:RRM Nup35-type domain-containing protein n=1 Tax=Fibroporia radiculosa TaxID=599839 RepID=J4I8N0_9APHY|nr:uncharacterized protein FIBRA_01717 [Fibroporia radiculosa]CCL99696.1 predicted protein [Fibroporia radiculosa]